MRDFLSNRARVKLENSPRSFNDPEVGKFLEARRGKSPPPEVAPPPGNPLPSYRKGDDSPAIPDEPGIKMTVERVVVLTDDSKCILRGAFRLPVLPHEVVKPPADPPQPNAPPPPTAVMGITLLLAGAETPGPWVVRLDVPSYDPIDPAAEAPAATGYFALDLLAAGVPRLPQTLFIYAFSGAILEGPLPAALIAESMLPK